MLFLTASVFFLLIVEDERVKRFLYVSVALIILVNICNYYKMKNYKRFAFQFEAQPDTKVMVWVEKPLKLCDTIFDSERYSNIQYVDHSGVVTIYLDYDSVNNVSDDQYIYYRYIMNNNKMSIIHKVPLNPKVPASSSEPEKLPTPSLPKKPFNTELKTMEKIDNLTVRRTKDITNLDTVIEEDSSDLDSIPDNELDKFFTISKNFNFTKPLEAILDDRSFAISKDHGVEYENVCDMEMKLAKFE